MVDRKQDEQSKETSVGDFAKDLAGLIGSFLVDLSKLAVRGLWAGYRSLNKPKTDQTEPDGEQAANRIGELARQVTGKKETADAVPDKAASGEKVPASNRYLDEDVVEDEEAAALLDDLLRETAANLNQSEPVAPTKAEAAPSPTKDAPTPPGADPVEEQLRERAAKLKTRPDDENTPALTYQTPAEREKIQAKLAEREALLAAEREQRAATSNEETEQQVRLREAMEADKARIQWEREQRAVAFQKAEQARRARQQSEKEEGSGSRLTDHEPDTPDVHHTGQEPDDLTKGD